jgi:4-amino-4-deoxy-L-arabinose transferase-like glycosyltransferase
MNKPPVKLGLAFALLVVYTIIWFGTLNYRHLIPSDEGRYAEMAREMLVSGDWITPRYNNYLYFEKPPLHIWATALVFQGFGIGEWQARLWSGMLGYLTILLVGFTAWRLYSPRAGLLAAVALGSAPMWVVGGHFNSLDTGLSAYLAAALSSFLLAQASQTAKMRVRWMLGCWVAMALATLSKGLIGIVLPAIVFVVYSIATWNWRIWKELCLFKGLLLFLFITAPWFILVSLRNPEFAQFFFINEHFQRFTQVEHSRPGSIYFFLPFLLLGFLPWLPQVGSAMLQAWRQHRGQFSSLSLISCWVLVILGFFSLSQSKLPGYIMPTFPALALLAGYAIDRRLNERSGLSLSWKVQAIFFVLLGLIGFAFLPLIGFEAKVDELLAYATYTQWVISALLVLIMLSLLTVLLARRYPLLSIYCYAMGFFLTCTIAGTGHEALGRAVSGVDLADRVKTQIPLDATIYSVRILDHTFPFYLGRTMVMVEFPDELEFGVKQEPMRWVPSLDAFIEQWKNEPTAYALMVPEQYLALQKMGLPMEEIGRDSRRVVVTHPSLRK